MNLMIVNWMLKKPHLNVLLKNILRKTRMSWLVKPGKNSTRFCSFSCYPRRKSPTNLRRIYPHLFFFSKYRMQPAHFTRWVNYHTVRALFRLLFLFFSSQHSADDGIQNSKQDPSDDCPPEAGDMQPGG